jgi:hypothetical protein
MNNSWTECTDRWRQFAHMGVMWANPRHLPGISVSDRSSGGTAERKGRARHAFRPWRRWQCELHPVTNLKACH